MECFKITDIIISHRLFGGFFFLAEDDVHVT